MAYRTPEVEKGRKFDILACFARKNIKFPVFSVDCKADTQLRQSGRQDSWGFLGVLCKNLAGLAV